MLYIIIYAVCFMDFILTFYSDTIIIESLIDYITTQTCLLQL